MGGVLQLPGGALCGLCVQAPPGGRRLPLRRVPHLVVGPQV